MKLEIGLSLYSVMGELKEDYMTTLENVAKAGYKFVEFITTPTDEDGNPVATPEEIGAKIRELGLTAISSHAALVPGCDVDAIVDANVKMGAHGIALPFAGFFTMDETRAMADFCNLVGKKCKERGLDFYYHNHSQEFYEIDGKYALYHLAELTDPNVVSFELDLYWVERAGVCPYAVMKQLGSRCKLIHQKDRNKEIPEAEINVMANAGSLTNPTMEPVLKEIFGKIKPLDIVPVGTGAMDVEKIVEVVSALDVSPYIIVELDSVSTFTESNYTTPYSPLESITVSYQNLRKIIG